MQAIGSSALVAVASLVLGGCATVINGTSQDVKFQSDPGGATVKLTGGLGCSTPCEISLKRRTDLRADFAKPGFKPAHVLIQSRTGGAMVGNLLLGGFIGGAVDASNGASNHLVPNPVNVQLAREGTTEEPMLIGEKGAKLAVADHNDKVRADVAKTIGVEAAGVTGGEATNDTAPVSAISPSDMTPAAAVEPAMAAEQSESASTADGS